MSSFFRFPHKIAASLKRKAAASVKRKTAAFGAKSGFDRAMRALI